MKKNYELRIKNEVTKHQPTFITLNSKDEHEDHRYSNSVCFGGLQL